MSKITLSGARFDGKSITGATQAEIKEATQANERALYAGSLGELPPPVGNVITLSLADGYNVMRATQPFNIAPNRIVLDSVAVDGNGGLGISIVTVAPGEALFTNADNTAVKISNLSFGNYGAGGTIFDFKNTDGIATGKSCDIQTSTIIQAAAIGVIANFFLLDLKGIATLPTVSGGLKIGSPSLPGAVITTIERFFMVSEMGAGDDVLLFDTTVPTGGQVTIEKLNLLSSLGFFGINVTNIANLVGLTIKGGFFDGSGGAINGFTSETANVTISECFGNIINTPTSYWAKYNDDATQTTPIPLPNGVLTQLTNDGVGGISRHLPGDIPDLWDVVNDKVLLENVPLGRPIVVIVNMDINVNQNTTTIKLEAIGLDAAVTVFSADTILMGKKNGYVTIERQIFIDVVSQDLKDNGVEIHLTIDDPVIATGTVKVNYITPKRG